jgi:hypothetical protein
MTRASRLASLSLALFAIALHVPAPAADATPTLSAASLYNEGNAYARAGKPGLAVLNYERARLLAPGDADLAANLAMVRRSAHVATATPSGVAQLLLLASPNFFACLGVVGVLVAGFGLLGAMRGARRRRAAVVLLVVGCTAVVITLADVLVWWPTLHAGVIITPDAPVRVAPAPMGDSLFALREAELVRIEAEHEGFLLVRTSSARTGWVAAANLARIVP